MRHTFTTIRSFLSLLFLSMPAFSFADQLALTNGDVLNGKMQEKTEDQVLWLSDNFGLLAIDKARIATLNGASLDAPTAVIFTNTYKGALSFTGGYSSGNIKREDWDLDGDVEWRHGNFRHSSEINFESHSLDDSKPAEQYDLGYGVDWFFQDKWFWSNALSWGANDDRSINQFYSIGSAIGRQFWDSEITALSAETGLLWISEDLKDQTTDRRLTWSWAADYRRMLGNNMEIFHRHGLLIALTDMSDSELNADIGLKVPVVANLFTELKLEWTYDNQPALGTRSTDSQLTVGVNYSW
jgi:putative salt-induced outer membrane protein YdiY